MDNEKFQDLMLEQLGIVLSKLSGMESELTEVKSDVGTLKSDVGTLKSELNEVKQSQVRMETEFGKKLDVLFYDWRETQKQFNERVETELKILGTKVEALQMESSKHDRQIKELYLVKAAKE
ncbi:Hypothetical protein DEACI_3372 [Acididesulfobacillus acetoxydans]|uniref:DUF1640 domain-containing protein n=1 Tax=Acididesulfobacillus acetoxydans TaxID=1561005 RepID=A0A8S0VY72_9FIRM|nr:hypothetical protein [Acididesulfobacillus acetoxydans]CAA7602693.1 Hypothetical protein DEACI_3372 [Acididesulfobacillus acetoxydans]CEJ06450.1 Hypothetical protein DEACI_0898 [Acididesulfobacillus acetoxydans]